MSANTNLNIPNNIPNVTVCIANNIYDSYTITNKLNVLNALVVNLQHNTQEFVSTLADLLTNTLFLKNINFELKLNNTDIAYNFSSYDVIYNKITWESHIKIDGNLTTFEMILLNFLENKNNYNSKYHNSNYNVNIIIKNIISSVKYNKITNHLNSIFDVHIPPIFKHMFDDEYISLFRQKLKNIDEISILFYADHIYKYNTWKSLMYFCIVLAGNSIHNFYPYIIILENTRDFNNIYNIDKLDIFRKILKNKPNTRMNYIKEVVKSKKVKKILDSEYVTIDYYIKGVINLIDEIFIIFTKKSLFQKDNNLEYDIDVANNFFKNINTYIKEQHSYAGQEQQSYDGSIFFVFLYYIIQKNLIEEEKIEQIFVNSSNFNDFDINNFFNLLNEFRNIFISITKDVLRCYNEMIPYDLTVRIEEFILEFNIIISDYYKKIIDKFNKQELILKYYNNFKNDPEFIKNYFPINYFDNQIMHGIGIYNCALANRYNTERYKNILEFGYNKKCTISTYYYLLFLKNNNEINFDYFKSNVINIFVNNIDSNLPYIDKLIITHIINNKINSDTELNDSFNNLNNICLNKYIKHIYPDCYYNLINNNIKLFDMLSIINYCVTTNYYKYANKDYILKFVDFILSTYNLNNLDLKNILSETYFNIVYNKIIYFDSISKHTVLLSDMTIKFSNYFDLINDTKIKLLISKTMLKIFNAYEMVNLQSNSESVNQNKLKYYTYGIDNNDPNILFEYYNDTTYNSTKDVKYLKLAADNNDIDAIYYYAEYLQNQNDIENANIYFKKIFSSTLLLNMIFINEDTRYSNSLGSNYNKLFYKKKEKYFSDTTYKFKPKNIFFLEQKNTYKYINDTLNCVDDYKKINVFNNHINIELSNKLLYKYIKFYANTFYYLLKNASNTNINSDIINIILYNVRKYFGINFLNYIKNIETDLKANDEKNIIVPDYFKTYIENSNNNTINITINNIIGKSFDKILHKLFELCIFIFNYGESIKTTNFYNNSISNYYNSLQKYNNTLIDDNVNKKIKQEINVATINLKQYKK